jgi:hypothetical protein
MNTPNIARRLFGFGVMNLALMAGCAVPENSAKRSDARPLSSSGIKERSLYEMAVSNEAARLSKVNPALSRKDAVATARKTVSFEDYNSPESPEELKAKKLKQERAEFASDFEKSMRQ